MKKLKNWLLMSICCVAWTAAATLAGPQDGRLDIYWVDAEGGAATLIVTPAGESVLIDTGNPNRRDPDRIVRTLTQQAKLRHIDHLIITHYHGDHYGGTATLAQMVPIRRLYDNGLTDDMPEPPPAKSYLKVRTDHRTVIQPGDRIQLKPSPHDGSAQLELVCLGTRMEFAEVPDEVPDNATACALHRPKDRDGSDNARSVVMWLRFGKFDFFDAGDLTWNQEYRLMCPKNPVGHVDVYQVSHHGLDTSNNPVVLQSLRPTVAIMNNGPTKGCMPEVFANLADTDSLQAIYQVHKNLRPDGTTNNVPDEYIANQAASDQCSGNEIKLSVAPDGNTYTVAIPANQHERTFLSKER